MVRRELLDLRFQMLDFNLLRLDRFDQRSCQSRTERERFCFDSSDSRPLRGKHLINHPHDPLGEGDRVLNSTVRRWRGPGAVLLGQLTSSKDCGHNPNYTFAAFVHGGQNATFAFYPSMPAE